MLLIAEALLALGRPAEAEQLLRPLAQRQPRHEALGMRLAQALAAKGDPQAAWQWLRRIPTQEQTSLEFLEVAQQIAQQAGQSAEAILYNAERNLRLGEYRYARLALEQLAKTPDLPASSRPRLQQLLANTRQGEQELQYLKQ
ncbi:MAG: tetratricopeptide repeat protein [Thiolinea sp.]